MLNLAETARLLEDLPAVMARHRRLTETTARQALADLRACTGELSALAGQNNCALPTTEPPDAIFPLPPSPDRLTVLAADGSQIFPDRHTPVLYYLINTAAIAYRHGSGCRPQIYQPPPVLVYHPAELLDSSGNLISPAEISLQRDLAERHTLHHLALNCTGEPVIALTDGPLRLHLADLSPPQRTSAAAEHQTILDSLQAHGVLVAGYTDRPRSTYVLAMLHLAALSPQPGDILPPSPYRHLTDLDLFRLFLPPNSRSAIFGLPQGEHTPPVCFFYLNVGQSENEPLLARVEIPPALAQNPQAVNLVHAGIVRQARLTGGYPYVLARAHELAAIGPAERTALETMLSTRLRQAGFNPSPSPKQAQKNLLAG